MTFFEPYIDPAKMGNEPAGTVTLRQSISKWCRVNKPKAEIMTITPALATLMLERNRENNRAQNDRAIGQYKKEMTDHRMMLTNQGIGFDTDGVLVDGQHRLMACIASGEPFESLVVFGLDPKSFLYVDSGYKRTAGHKAGIAGFHNPSNLAAAARIILINDLFEISLRAGTLGVSPKNSRDRLPDEFIVDFLEENPKFVEMRKWFSIYGKFKPCTCSTLHAVHWMIHRKHPSLANNYIEQICYGESLNRSENVYRLREHLMALYISREKISKAWQLCWIIDAFNDTRRGKTTKFEMVAGRDFPKVLS